MMTLKSIIGYIQRLWTNLNLKNFHNIYLHTTRIGTTNDINFNIKNSTLSCRFRCSWINWNIINISISDSQMVTHLFWVACMGGDAAGVAHSAPAPTSPYTPRSAARDLLLYHHRLVELALGKVTFLVHTRDHHRSLNRLQAPSWWYEMGSKTFIEPTCTVLSFC